MFTGQPDTTHEPALTYYPAHMTGSFTTSNKYVEGYKDPLPCEQVLKEQLHDQRYHITH